MDKQVVVQIVQLDHIQLQEHVLVQIVQQEHIMILQVQQHVIVVQMDIIKQMLIETDVLLVQQVLGVLQPRKLLGIEEKVVDHLVIQ